MSYSDMSEEQSNREDNLVIDERLQNSMTEPQKSEGSASFKEQIARKELEYFKHRYKLHERQIKELDDIIELLMRQREAEAEKRGRIDELQLFYVSQLPVNNPASEDMENLRLYIKRRKRQLTGE